MAHIRMWAGDYTLSGLVGFELRCKTVGILGTGAIGAAAARIFCVSPSAADLPVLCLGSAAPILMAGGAYIGPCRPHRALPSSLAACELLRKTAGIPAKRAVDSDSPAHLLRMDQISASLMKPCCVRCSTCKGESLGVLAVRRCPSRVAQIPAHAGRWHHT